MTAPQDPQIPVVEGRPISDESKRLQALFDEMEKGQLTFLDESAKRIVELVTLLLGVLFTVMAFGDKFPPPYFASSVTKAVALITLTLYVIALLLGVCAMLPRRYKRYEDNATEMRRELDKLITAKLAWFRASAIVFALATVGLAALIGSIVLGV